jgi:nucleotide-binding universal stress UspA family protein
MATDSAHIPVPEEKIVNWTAFTILIAGWVLTGLITGRWMARRGHDQLWTLISVILGPLFVPIAYERIERHPRAIEVVATDRWRPAAPGSDELRVMIGYDGSTEARHALRAALQLFGPRGGVLELVTVISHDDPAGPDSVVFHAAKQRLADAASTAGEVPVGYAILAGPAGPCLQWHTEGRRAHLLVVRKRGQDMSTRMLGGVAEYLIARCPIPVLAVDPTATSTLLEEVA